MFLRAFTCLCFCVLLFAALPARAETPATYDELIQQGVFAKNAGNYAEAMRAFSQAKAFSPTSSEAWYLEGVTLSFQKKYDEAIAHLEKALELDPKNTEARLHLEKVRTWKHAKDKAPKLAAPIPAPVALYRWQVDMGYATSRFSRVEQENWRDGTLQLNYLLPDDATRVYGKEELFRRFGTYNRHYEVGTEHRWGQGASAYLSVGGSPEADFIPQWRLRAGGSYRILHGDPLLGDTILTLDTIYDDYEEGTIRTVNPGLQYYVTPELWLTAKHINVIDAESARLMGWFLRGDWQVIDRLRLNIGAAHAPETVDAVTVSTRSRFLGMALDVTDRATLYLGLSRDDREGSYINKTLSSGLSVKF
jgi:YaiO family outer membrane protein